MSIEAMKQALEVMEAAIKAGDWKVDGACDPDMAIHALRQAIEQAEKREWVGLTDEERNHARQTITYSQLAMTAGEWTEAVQIETERRLKEKNT